MNHITGGTTYLEFDNVILEGLIDPASARAYISRTVYIAVNGTQTWYGGVLSDLTGRSGYIIYRVNVSDGNGELASGKQFFRSDEVSLYAIIKRL